MKANSKWMRLLGQIASPFRDTLTNMCVVVNWTFHFQQCQIVFECGRVVLTMHHNAFYIFCDWTFLLEFARYIVLAENGNECCQESVGCEIERSNQIRMKMKSNRYLPGLTMSGGHNEVLRYQHSAAFVLREQAQPRRFSHQNLPWPFAECGSFAANDSPALHMGPYAAFCRIQSSVSSENAFSGNFASSTYVFVHFQRMRCFPPLRQHLRRLLHRRTTIPLHRILGRRKSPLSPQAVESVSLSVVALMSAGWLKIFVFVFIFIVEKLVNNDDAQ